MSNVKHIKGLPKPEPMTPEEKAEHVARFLSQQRISLTQGVAFNMMQNPAAADLTPAQIADKAVAVADALIERLFPIPEKKEDER